MQVFKSAVFQGPVSVGFWPYFRFASMKNENESHGHDPIDYKDVVYASMGPTIAAAYRFSSNVLVYPSGVVTKRNSAKNSHFNIHS